MGRFPWTAAHFNKDSNKDSNSDKISLDQRSKSSGKSRAEPSRHAVNQLLNYIGDGEISPPRTPQSRTKSPATSSLVSFPGKSSKSSVDQQRPPTREDTIHQLPDESTRQETSARNLFNKSSRILRRKTSKKTLGQARSDIRFVPGFSVLEDSQQPQSDSTAKSSLSNSSSSSPKFSDIKPSISGPYGFQHLAHTGQDQFRSLNRVSESDLLNEITAVPQVEAPVDQVGSVAITHYPISTDEQVVDTTSPPIPSAITAMPLPPLPSTPPRLHQAAHRDVSPSPETSQVPTSRSVENFSRPTRSPVTSTSGFSPVFEHSAPRLSGRPVSASLESLSNWAEETVGKLASVADSRHRSAGLPQIPEDAASQPPVIVHAVSTNDESAVSLGNSLLPDSLQATGLATESKTISMHELGVDQEQHQAYGVLRHSQSFPSTTFLRRRSQSSGDIPLVSNFAGITSPSPSTIKSVRISIGIKRIDVEDWEDAIDYAWDHPLDMEEDPGLRVIDSHSAEKTPSSRPESFFVVRQPSYDPTTQPSTPLMMQAPDKPLPVPDPSKRDSRLNQSAANASLRGLCIASTTPTPQSPGIEIVPGNKSSRESFGGPLDGRPVTALPREPDSPMSKSSSQESIILSIASSIMGTCRSSNSSTSLGDIGMLNIVDDETGDVSSRAPSAAITTKSVQIAHDTIEYSDSDGSQETIISEATPAVHTAALRPLSAEEPSQTAVRTIRSTSISEALVPNRSSSITGRTGGKTPGARSRSSTLTNRPRYTASRASYSLFPTVQPAPVSSSTQAP